MRIVKNCDCMIVTRILMNRRVCCMPLQLYKRLEEWTEKNELTTGRYIVTSENKQHRRRNKNE